MKRSVVDDYEAIRKERDRIRKEKEEEATGQQPSERPFSEAFPVDPQYNYVVINGKPVPYGFSKEAFEQLKRSFVVKLLTSPMGW